MKQIITNIASTFAMAPLVYAGLSSTDGLKTVDDPQLMIRVEKPSIQGVERTTEIAKYYLANSTEESLFGMSEARFLQFVNHFADTQIDLEDDFVNSLNRLEEKKRNPEPKRIKF